MGILEIIGIGGGAEGKIRRLQKKSMEKFGPPENRQGAIEELGELGTAPAIEALLMRFTIRVDPGITDDEEKARVMALIVQAGATALAPVKRFILGRDETSWPLRARAELQEEAAVGKCLVEVAREVGGEDNRVRGRKVLVLHPRGH